MQNAMSVSERMVRKYVFQRTIIRAGALLLAVSMLGHVGEGGVISYLATHVPEPKYFFTDSHANLVEAKPLDQPVMSDDDLRQWATKIGLCIYNVNYTEYRDKLNECVLANMTLNGGESLLASLKSSHYLDELKENHLMIHSAPTGGPVYSRSPLVERGVLSWQIEVPIVAVFENTKQPRRQDLLLKIVVVRAPTRVYPMGVAIDAIDSSPYSPSSS